MIEIEGVVREVYGNALLIEVRPQSGCGRCHEPGGCGGGLINGDGKLRNFRLPNTIGANAGDIVLVGVEDGSVLKGALSVYGIPGALMLTGAALGTALGASDAVAGIGALLGLTMGVTVLHLFANRFSVGGAAMSVRRYDGSIKCERKT